MEKNIYDESYMPKIEEQQVIQAFREIIGTGIEVFAKENGMSIEYAKELFQTKLKNITIKIFDEEKITKDSSEDEKKLRGNKGLTVCKIDPEKPEKEARKTINIASWLLEDNDELKSTLIHEIYHLVLSDDKLNFRNGQYVYNKGCHEVCFENGKIITDMGNNLHEGIVARMEKKVCQKEGIIFKEEGIFASGYINEINILNKFEKISGMKVKPIENLAELKMLHGKNFENLIKTLDEQDYSKSEEILIQIKDKKIQQTYGNTALYIVQMARNLKENISSKLKNLFPKKNDFKMLDAPNIIKNNENVGQGKKTKSASQIFEDRISENGRLKNIQPLVPRNLSEINNQLKDDYDDRDFE